jgi:regulator of replication initiation timing
MIDYSKWSAKRLIKEVLFLREALHKLAKETQHVVIENVNLKKRLAAIERHRAVFGG